MNIRSLHALALAVGLVTVAGATHAAWGHSDHAHVEAYRHLQTTERPQDAATDRIHAGKMSKKHAWIRAFDGTFTEDNPGRPATGGRS